MCTDGSFERHSQNAADGIRALEAFQKCRRWDKIKEIAIWRESGMKNGKLARVRVGFV